VHFFCSKFPRYPCFSYAQLARRMMSDISASKEVIRYHPQFQGMPGHDVRTLISDNELAKPHF
jgi:hypothetical protein